MEDMIVGRLSSGSFGVVAHWPLNEVFYPGVGAYVEAYSRLRHRRVGLRKIRDNVGRMIVDEQGKPLPFPVWKPQAEDPALTARYEALAAKWDLRKENSSNE